MGQAKGLTITSVQDAAYTTTLNNVTVDSLYITCPKDGFIDVSANCSIDNDTAGDITYVSLGCNGNYLGTFLTCSSTDTDIIPASLTYNSLRVKLGDDIELLASYDAAGSATKILPDSCLQIVYRGE